MVGKHQANSAQAIRLCRDRFLQRQQLLHHTIDYQSSIFQSLGIVLPGASVVLWAEGNWRRRNRAVSFSLDVCVPADVGVEACCTDPNNRGATGN